MKSFIISMYFITLVISSFSMIIIADDKLPFSMYGDISKESRWVSQKNDDLNKFYLPVDVNNFESRIGMKGEKQFDNTTLGYRLELGVNSTSSHTVTIDSNTSTVSATSGRIRMRLAYGSISGSWGKLIMGQDFTAISLDSIRHDPLFKSGFGLIAVDLRNIVSGSSKQNIGFKFRTRKDLLGYESPSFSGLRLKITIDNNDYNSNTLKSANSQFIEGLLTYTKKLGNDKLDLSLGYADHSTEKNKSPYQMIGIKYYNEDIKTKITAIYGIEKLLNREGGTENSERKRLGLGISHKITKEYNIAANYGKINLEDGLGSDSQMALSFKYSFNKYADFSFSVGTFDVKRKDTSENNNATAAIVGTVIRI